MMDKPWPTMNPIQFQEFNPTRTGDKRLDLDNIRAKVGHTDASHSVSASGKRMAALTHWDAKNWADSGMN